MAVKKSLKNTANKVKKKPNLKKEPSNNQLLKKVASVSDSTKTLSKEIKLMTKIFADNQIGCFHVNFLLLGFSHLDRKKVYRCIIFLHNYVIVVHLYVFENSN